MKCPSCGYENSQDARYCGLCQASFGSFAREPSAPYGLPPLAEPRREAVQAAQKVLRGQSAGENWFQRHLNWTWVFASWAVTLLYFVVGVAYLAFFTHSFIVNSTFSFVSFFMSVVVIRIIFIALYLIAEFGVGAWVLTRKNRSQWWLLMLIAPLPFYLLSSWLGWLFSLLGLLAAITVFICFLRLENYNLLEELPVSSGPSGYSGSSESSSSIQPGLAPRGLGAQYGKYGS